MHWIARSGAVLGWAVAFVPGAQVSASISAPKVVAAQFATPGVYRGRTAQGFPVAMRVIANGRLAFATTIRVECSPGGPQNRPFVPPASFQIRSSQFSAKVGPRNGSVYQLAGRFTGRSSAVGVFTLGSTRIVFGGYEVCVTRGWVRWSAIRVR